MMKPISPVTRTRFYKTVQIAEQKGEGLEVQLDGRPIRTPGGRKLALPPRALAQRIADEWAAQGEQILPATLPLTKLANSAIDGVAGREAEVVEDIVKYTATDLVCYRASSPEGLVARQTQLWDPILVWAEATFRATFVVTTGIKHVAQSEKSLNAIKEALVPFDPFKLAALHVMASLAGSGLIALAHAKGFLDGDSAWMAANVDEDWQVAQWGEDFEAIEHRRRRFEDFQNASIFFSLC